MNKKKQIIPLTKLLKGEKAKFLSFEGELLMQKRLHDIGLTKNTQISVISRGIFGDPIAIRTHNIRIAIGKKEAAKIKVECI